MKIIVELMEAYADHTGLPLSLVNLAGEIDFKAKVDNHIPEKNELTAHFLELKEVANQLKKPTIIALPNQENTDIYYVVTPEFKVSGSGYFLVAGPFNLENRLDSTTNHSNPILFSKKEIEEKIVKMHNLFEILVMKDKTVTDNLVPEKIVNVLQILGDFDCEIDDYDEYICQVLNHLLTMKSFDFLGLAVKNEDDIFVIKHAIGENLPILLGTSFYLGEGLLGKAAILGKDFVWNKRYDFQRNDLFNRLSLSPTHLFGTTLKKEEKVERIIFGGNYKEEEAISESILNLILCIVRFITQKEEITHKMNQAMYSQDIFSNWIDLMDVIQHMKDKKYIAYKILDFCQTLNRNTVSCLSTMNHEFIQRGKMDIITMDKHKQAVNYAAENPTLKIWQEDQFLHFCLNIEEQRYAICTINFIQQEDIKQAKHMLSTMDTFLQFSTQVNESKKNHENTALFQLLHTTIQQMNPQKYQLSIEAVNTMKRLIDRLAIADEKKGILENICSVMPFELDYLEQAIAHTEEWSYIKEMNQVIQNKFVNEVVEYKLLAFVNQAVIHKVSPENMLFLSPALQKVCVEMHELERESSEEYNLIFENELEHKVEIHDLKEVISAFALTSREKEILYLIIEGLNNNEVGQYLNISVHTVKNHVTNLFKKLNVSDRMQAMAKIYRIKYEEN